MDQVCVATHACTCGDSILSRLVVLWQPVYNAKAGCVSSVEEPAITIVWSDPQSAQFAWLVTLFISEHVAICTCNYKVAGIVI